MITGSLSTFDVFHRISEKIGQNASLILVSFSYERSYSHPVHFIINVQKLMRTNSTITLPGLHDDFTVHIQLSPLPTDRQSKRCFVHLSPDHSGQGNQGLIQGTTINLVIDHDSVLTIVQVASSAWSNLSEPSFYHPRILRLTFFIISVIFQVPRVGFSVNSDKLDHLPPTVSLSVGISSIVSGFVTDLTRLEGNEKVSVLSSQDHIRILDMNGLWFTGLVSPVSPNKLTYLISPVLDLIYPGSLKRIFYGSNKMAGQIDRRSYTASTWREPLC